MNAKTARLIRRFCATVPHPHPDADPRTVKAMWSLSSAKERRTARTRMRRRVRLACECGKTRERGEPACARCQALDGATLAEASTIAALRDFAGPATVADLRDALSLSARTVRRGLADLVARGRVDVRYERDRPGKALALYALVPI